ncbi:MAG TPA: ferrous iron transport protein B [Tepidimicrobium sp.]|nr:ferrous iron transport protein B [Tepidimicrobium sp.]
MVNENVLNNSPNKSIIGLAGNPNTGKSTLFNHLTGLNQHTGNWPGKTVASAKGEFTYNGVDYVLVDLPGTYSLFINSPEEEIARNFICFDKPDITIVVVDGTKLERNLNLVFQIMEATNNIIVCINFMDEVKEKGIQIDIDKLSRLLGIPILPIIARDGKGIEKLLETMDDINHNRINLQPKRVSYNEHTEDLLVQLEEILSQHTPNELNARWIALRLIDGDPTMSKQIKEKLKNYNTYDQSMEIQKALDINKEISEHIVTTIYEEAESIGKKVVNTTKIENKGWDTKLDNILTNKITAYPIMLLLLGLLFWITIIGSNYPSDALAKLFFIIEPMLSERFLMISPPSWLHDIVIFGVYRTISWVISVMLPPMAIFFPLFSLLEDIGYLPRVAFNLDDIFRKAGTQGKQALTMSMGFGCNAAGIISTRIIDSPREKLIAIVTNNFVPCNGRFPIIITISTIFMGKTISSKYSSIIAAFYVLTMVIIGIIATLVVSKLLSRTFLKNIPSSFTLELPPYRRPQIGKILVRSFFDKTLLVLSKAVIVAAPAGVITWLFANINFAGRSLLNISAGFLNPLGQLLGLDGFILMAFLLGLPANEIVLPILIMSYMSKGAMLELNNLNTLKNLLLDNGWTSITALNFMLFSLLHFPCATTLLTIKNETNGLKWPIFTFLLTTGTAILTTFSINMIYKALL